MHFEIHADNPERAVNFYASVFGWEIKKWDGPEDYWLITTGEEDEPGINGAIKPQAGNLTTVNSVTVSSVDEFLLKIAQAGGKTVQPKTAVPGIGYSAYCQDSEGNTFGIWQHDRTAK
jgi:predicted enzyme related to lactoylglutathione lyase